MTDINALRNRIKNKRGSFEFDMAMGLDETESLLDEIDTLNAELHGMQVRDEMHVCPQPASNRLVEAAIHGFDLVDDDGNERTNEVRPEYLPLHLDRAEKLIRGMKHKEAVADAVRDGSHLLGILEELTESNAADYAKGQAEHAVLKALYDAVVDTGMTTSLGIPVDEATENVRSLLEGGGDE